MQCLQEICDLKITTEMGHKHRWVLPYAPRTPVKQRTKPVVKATSATLHIKQDMTCKRHHAEKDHGSRGMGDLDCPFGAIQECGRMQEA